MVTLAIQHAQAAERSCQWPVMIGHFNRRSLRDLMPQHHANPRLSPLNPHFMLTADLRQRGESE